MLTAISIEVFILVFGSYKRYCKQYKGRCPKPCLKSQTSADSFQLLWQTLNVQVIILCRDPHDKDALLYDYLVLSVYLPLVFVAQCGGVWAIFVMDSEKLKWRQWRLSNIQMLKRFKHIASNNLKYLFHTKIWLDQKTSINPFQPKSILWC